MWSLPLPLLIMAHSTSRSFWGLELAYQRVPGVVTTSGASVLCMHGSPQLLVGHLCVVHTWLQT